MDLTVTAQVIGDAQVKERFRQVDSSVRERVRRTLLDLGARLRDLARSLAPRGKTHRLEPSINARFRESNNTMTERVGKPIFYGRFLEQGLDTMRQPRRLRGVVGVRTITTKLGAVLVRPVRGRLKAHGQPHRFVLRARPFMQPAMDSIRSEIPGLLQAAVGAAAEET